MMTFKRVRELDPLEVDSQLRDLPALNGSADIDAISTIVDDAVSRLDVTTYDKDSATAAMRDLDFLLSSSLRHGVDLVVEGGRIESVLLGLGKIACMIPRGTVSTYALANPRGERERSFTGSPEERLFIESVRSGAESVESSLETYVNEGKLVGLAAMENSISHMITSIIDVKRGVSPTYFTGQLRPYFDPLTIGGESYAGSGGAQLQFIAVDYLLWGVDCDNPVYQDYFADNVRYLSPEQRAYLELGIYNNDGKSILRSAVEDNDGQLSEQAIRVLQGLKKFRYPHRKLARDNFKIRPDGSVGSGIYTTDILDILLDETVVAIEKLERIVHE